jgi:hypothetical protein
MLELPTRYTTFKQIGEINEQDINWLIKHFSDVNESGRNGPKTKFAATVFRAIKK